MQLANSKTQYGAVPQILHWLTALFVICGWLLGTFLDDLPKGPIRSSGLVIHMTLGQFVVVFLIALLVAVPFMGILVQLKRGHALPLFGIWDLNSPWPVDRAMAKGLLEVHEYLADALLLLAGVHAAAALMHHYLFEDRTLLRMLPGVSPPPRRRAKARGA